MAKITDVVEKLSESVIDGYQQIEDKFSEKFLNENGELKSGKIGEAVTESFNKIENSVVESYKKIEAEVVESFGKVSDKFVEKFFAKEGESVEDAKKRLSDEE